ncbi:MAG: hypothetical protein AB7P07_03155, partial [Hyphomonadaceae bacterium]
SFGARPLGRLIQEQVKKPMADELLFGRLKNGGIVKIDTDPSDTEKLKFEYFPELKQPSSPPQLRRPEKA